MLAAAKEACQLTDQWFVYVDAKYQHDVVKDTNSKTGASIAVSPALPFPISVSLTENLEVSRSLHDTTNLRCGVYLWGSKTPVLFPPGTDPPVPVPSPTPEVV